MYRALFLIVGVFAAALGALLLVAPDVYLSLYVDQDTAPMGFAAQRLAPAVVGLGALLILASNLPPGPFASRFAILCALVWFGIAATGLFHFATGAANTNILVAGVSEIILGVLFALAGRQHRAA